ncbi:Lsr2 family DNA-binding protein [Haloactinospora alba]|uniref:Lsr2 family DNA-binding protein n=1 Tax=Haloactinospora alba TaxID=405555 RepID=UPI0011535683|nr:histone-like nucleoid-structuring protein Lsr2 [Haloactinospora alba]
MSYAIRAHPDRADLVADLLARLGLDETHVVWDRWGDSWDTGRRAWQAHDPDADWHLVIEDDAIVSRDLLPAVEQTVETLPEQSVLSLYLGREGSRGIAAAAERATTRGAAWVQAPHLVWGVAIAAPTASIPAMLDWCDRLEWPSRVYDTRLAAYYQHRAWPAWYPVPSWVDHGGAPSLLGRGARRQALAFVGADASALEELGRDGGVVRARTRTRKETTVSDTDLVIAKTSAVVRHHGRRAVIQKGTTVAEKGADIVRDHEHLWEPIRVDYPAEQGSRGRRVEDTTAAPGQVREADTTVAAAPKEEPTTEAPAEPTTKQVRRWAKEQGYEVPSSGKLPEDLVAAYKRAHGGGW